MKVQEAKEQSLVVTDSFTILDLEVGKVKNEPLQTFSINAAKSKEHKFSHINNYRCKDGGIIETHRYNCNLEVIIHAGHTPEEYDLKHNPL